MSMEIGRFLEVDADEDGTITFLEFMSMPEFCGSPLIDRYTQMQ